MSTNVKVEASVQIGSGVSPELSRSWLLANPLQTSSVDELYANDADQVILDLEDAVPAGEKDTARERVLEWLRAGGLWVRVNSVESGHWTRDMEGLRGSRGLAGVMLAKAESADEVEATSAALAGEVRVIPLVESAIGIERATEIASARGAFRIAFGSGDYRRDTGANADALAMTYPRSRLVVSSRVANLPGPIDGPTVTADRKTVRAGCEPAVAVGMTGKLCLNVDHLTTINEGFSPTHADMMWAIEFLAAHSRAMQPATDGSYPPQLARARKLVELGEAYNIIRRRETVEPLI